MATEHDIGRIVKYRTLQLTASYKPDYIPDYRGIVVLEDNILVTDREARNLQIYNRLNGKRMYAPHELDYPIGVCILSNTEVAVCMLVGEIVILSLNRIRGVKPVKTFDVRTGFGVCDSMAKWTSDKIIVSGRKDALLCWCVVSLEDGSIDSTCGICKVKGMCRTRVAVKGNTLYVACETDTHDTEGVYAFDMLNPQHKLKFLYQHQLEDPFSIMADSDYVYVSDMKSKAIYQVTDTGKLVAIHKVSSDIFGMFYDDQHRVLYTTSSGTNEITLYKIEYPHHAGIPVEILNMGDRSIQLFEDALKDGRETIHNIRIMVCGCVGVGKSTLVKRLLGEKVNISERQSTEGIDVYVNCCDVSLLTKEWIRQEQNSEQDYKLQRLVKVLNENYKTFGRAADQEHVVSHQREKFNQNPIEVAADSDKNTEIQSQQNIGQKLLSTASHQEESPSVHVYRTHNQPDKKMIPGKGAEDIHSNESQTTDTLREMLAVLKENNNKTTLDITKFAQLSIWDFPGQCAFYTTHQMFLTRRAIYLLVANVSGQIDDVVEDEYYLDTVEKNKYKAQGELVEVWMNSIHSCAPSDTETLKSAHSSASSNTVIPPPVILVGTHVDRIPQRQSATKASKEYKQPQTLKATKSTSEPTRKTLMSSFKDSFQAFIARLLRKGKTGKGREIDTVLFWSTQKGVTCANPEVLHQVLNYSTPEAFSSRSTLEMNCENMGLQIHGETPGNGNCFFEAVSSQLQRLHYPVQRTPQQLRHDVVAFLKTNKLLQTSTGNINFADFMCNESFEEYCERMENDGEWADHVLVVAMARALQRDILIVTSLPSSGIDDVIAWVVGQDNFQEDPILLGHIWEHHYESLEPTDSDIMAKHWGQLVGQMSFEKNNKLYRQKRGQEYLKEIRSYLGDKPVVFHLVDEDFALDNSIVDSRLEDLKRKILDVASQQPYWGEQIPTRWFLLEQHLISLRDTGLKVISRVTVEDLNKKGTVQIKESEELDLFLKYLHETGTIIYFSIDILRDNIVLDPKWMIDALKSLINAHPNLPNNSAISVALSQKWLDFKDKGILTSELVDAIWSKENHPELHAHKSHILMLMEQLNILNKPKSFTEIGEKVEDYFLAPCMLRQEPPTEVISPEQDSSRVTSPEMRCIFTEKYLPTPVFHRLLAACVSRWPVAKSETSENLIFCCCCVYDLDLFHRLTVYMKSHVITAKITRLLIDEIKTPDAKLCSRVRRFITLNLDKIISYLGLNLPYDLQGARQTWLADEGHDPDSPLTREHMNHSRLCVALVTVCGNALRDVLRKHVPAPHTSIHQAILANKGKLTQGRPLLNADQIQMVFPDPQGTTTGNVDHFDISLLYILLRNISSVAAPVTGWGKEPQDNPRDTTLGASIERIRLFRNHIIGHSKDGKVKQGEFDDYWNKFDAILDDIEHALHTQGYKAILENQRRQVISVYEAC